MEDFRKLEIDDANLDRELSEQASKYLFVAEKAVNAEFNYESYKAQTSQLYAQLDSKVREAAVTEGRKVTEAVVKAEIETHPDYVKAQQALISKRAQKELMRAVRESWHMRKDLLIQMAIKQRSEIDAVTASVKKAA
jgi:hypothetical protein